jgi:hypothetical protein
MASESKRNTIVIFLSAMLNISMTLSIGLVALFLLKLDDKVLILIVLFPSLLLNALVLKLTVFDYLQGILRLGRDPK